MCSLIIIFFNVLFIYASSYTSFNILVKSDLLNVLKSLLNFLFYVKIFPNIIVERESGGGGRGREYEKLKYKITCVYLNTSILKPCKVFQFTVLTLPPHVSTLVTD